MTDEQYTDIAIEISRNVKYPYVKMGKNLLEWHNYMLHKIC